MRSSFRILLVLVLALGLASVGDVARADGYDGGTALFSFRDPRITESSGVVASSRRDDVFFTHNDSGDSARFFAVDRLGCTLRTFNLSGVIATDIEDIARGPFPAGSTAPSIWLADIGDNNHMRSEIVVHRITEPELDNSSTNRSSTVCRTPDEVSVVAESFVLKYPDTPHDAETLLADPVSGQLLIVTKTPLGQSSIYTTPADLRSDAVNVLVPAGAIVFPPSTTYDRPLVPEAPGTQQGFDVAGRLMAVGGDVAGARDRVVVRTYTDGWEWAIAPGQPIAEALTLSTPVQIPFRYQRQGESVGYTRDGTAMLTTCEDAGCTAYLYRRT